MEVWQLFVTAAVAALLVSPSCCQYVSHVKANGSAADFDSFRKTFHRLYEVNSEEFIRRNLCFQNSTKRHRYLNSFSADPLSATYGINQFSDLSQMEFRDLYLRAFSRRVPVFSGLTMKGLPAKFDWRDKGVVAPVQNQLAGKFSAPGRVRKRLESPHSPTSALLQSVRPDFLLETRSVRPPWAELPQQINGYAEDKLPYHCGSCWAFSVVGAVQSVSAIGGSQLEQLSVQQVVDCAYKNEGCNGGYPSHALAWLKETKVKLVPQSEYPYKAKTGICHFFSQSHDGVSVKDFNEHDFSGQEEAMMGQLVQHGPLVVIVDAVSWQDYLGGIIQHHCSSQWSNHAVLVVGYDTTGEIPFWIVQNSWGTSWGNDGYVYIKIGSNVCGVTNSVAAVFV